MPGKQFASEQIITKIREAEVLLSQGMTVGEAAGNWESASRFSTAREKIWGIGTTQAGKLNLKRKIF